MTCGYTKKLEVVNSNIYLPDVDDEEKDRYTDQSNVTYPTTRPFDLPIKSIRYHHYYLKASILRLT